LKHNLSIQLTWLAFECQRPIDPSDIINMLVLLASHVPQTLIGFEARGNKGQVKYYLGADRKLLHTITAAISNHGDIRFSEVPHGERMPIAIAKQLKINKPILPLKTDTNIIEAVAQAGIGALQQAKAGESVVVQILLGQPHQRKPMPSHLPDPHASRFKVIFGDVEKASAESQRAVRDKLSQPSFDAIVRLGATSEGHILSLFSALRTMQSGGVSIQTVAEKPENLNYTHIPRHFPLRLSCDELASFLMLPIGEAEYMGVSGLHPRTVPLPAWYRNPQPKYARTFAISHDSKSRLSISVQDAREHLVVMGPTGVGKSTLLQHLILADIYAGHSCLIIDPKGELETDLLKRYPEWRDDDLVLMDMSHDCPAGFNPLIYSDHKNPSLTADAILSVMREVWRDHWGVRSTDVLSHSLLTLAHTKNATLLWLVPLLTDDTFRRKVTAGVQDNIALKQFWQSYEAMSPNERRVEIASVLNKLRQLYLRPELRSVLGQATPRFNLADLFNKPRVVLVSLNKSTQGEEATRMIGTLIISLAWQLSLGRAKIPAEQRRFCSIYIDELQDFVALPTSFGDALVQARGMNVALIAAHQHRSQLSDKLLGGIDSNMRNKICFRLENPADARAMAAFAPNLEAVDFQTLPRYHIYTAFNQSGRNTGYVSGITIPPNKPHRNPDELRAKSAARYGRPAADVEREYYEALGRYSEKP